MGNRTITGTVDASGYISSGGAEVDPISRIEGHLGVKLTTNASGFVSEANVHGNLWRGFENFLLGRSVNDAITFTQRICGVCPVPHGQTSTYAVDAALGYSRSHITFETDSSDYGVPAKAVLIRNLVLSAEFLMSHLTHFYHLVALDYVQGPAAPPWTPWFDDSFYSTLLKNPGSTAIVPRVVNGFSQGLWDAAITQYVKALRMRRLTFEAGALFAGRMPMTSCFVGGGVTFDGSESPSERCTLFKTLIEEVGEFIVKEHVPLVLALGALYIDYDNSGNSGFNPPLLAGTGKGYGAGVGRFLAWGAFPSTGTTGTLGLPGGVAGTAADFQVLNKADVYAKFLGDAGTTNSVSANLKESIAYSHYAISELDKANIDATTKLGYPGAVQRTQPDRTVGYSYIKSPRWNGQSMEVGPFARMVVAGFYSVTGGYLRDGFSTAKLGVTGYDAFVGSITASGSGAGTYTGLKPALVGSDLAVACVRDGIADLYVVDASGNLLIANNTGAAKSGDPAGAAYVDATAASQSTLTGAYGGTAIIMGTVTSFVYNLKGGLSVMDRLRGRALEALYLVQKMVGKYNGATWDTTGWVSELAGMGTAATWRAKTPPSTAQVGKWGGTEAPRGALMHFVSTNALGKITAYQAVVPTTWNASPRDVNGTSGRGPIEQAMVGIPYSDVQVTKQSAATGNNITAYSGLEALRVAHTFDPCIACAIH